MIKVAQIQLKPGIRQQEILTETLRTANKACGEISSVTFEEKLFVSRHVLQQKTYYPIRAKYPSLSPQMLLHCVFKVFDSYQKVRKLAAEEIGESYQNTELRQRSHGGEVALMRLQLLTTAWRAVVS